MNLISLLNSSYLYTMKKKYVIYYISTLNINKSTYSVLEKVDLNYYDDIKEDMIYNGNDFDSYKDAEDFLIENHKNLNLYRVDIIIQEIVYFNY